MMLEGYARSSATRAFFAFQKALDDRAPLRHDRRGGQFIALAKRIAAEKAGFEASNLAKLDEYFQQWLSAPASRR